jgi:hypothetical protein
MNFEFSREILDKYSNIKFYETLSIGSCCSMQTDGLTDLTKVIVAYQNFANAPNYLA